ncbi:GTP-binding protein [Dokdonia sinensis]|uniref:GTP-binding protein n=1 Tax=Dokdonia sinensis TaxID=2479847 RepID=A0A3M0GHI6_9FLAO|nr:GTP-binding protein [Dokdonia sinensis]RMB64134.1 GTP-binding protein [Dokdonia sinensis]
MHIPNDLVLRPRFTLKMNSSPEKLLSSFENTGKMTTDFVISRVDDHVFIRIPKKKQHFWSPQLHLEIYSIEKHPTVIKGLFGPSPTVWTLFMFLHFVVASLFIAAGIWMYTNIALGDSLLAPLICMILLFISWFVLYIAGRWGKKSGQKEMQALQSFMYKVLSKQLP